MFEPGDEVYYNDPSTNRRCYGIIASEEQIRTHSGQSSLRGEIWAYWDNHDRPKYVTIELTKVFLVKKANKRTLPSFL